MTNIANCLKVLLQTSSLALYGSEAIKSSLFLSGILFIYSIIFQAALQLTFKVFKEFLRRPLLFSPPMVNEEHCRATDLVTGFVLYIDL